MVKRLKYDLKDVDEVERMREIRRQLQERYPTTDEFDRWLIGLQRQHDRRVKQRKKKAARVAS